MIRNLISRIQRRAPRDVRASEVMEVGVLAICAGVMAFLIATGLGRSMTHAPSLTEDALRHLVATSGFDMALCPDGWAARHAPLQHMTEAEVTAWYLSEANVRSDNDVIEVVGQWFATPRDFRLIEGDGLTYTQINLCIAESRRLI